MNEHFAERFGRRWVGGQWFAFGLDGGGKTRYCQIDGLFVPKPRQLTLVEVKLRHVAEAFFQLTNLYLPVARAAFGAENAISLCEVVRWFDPHTYFPVEPQFVDDLAFVEGSGLNVLIHHKEAR